MSEEPTPVNVRILDKDYFVSCEPHEEDELRASSQLLDQRMREIRQAGRVIGTDRIAVMAALNIAHELIQQQNARNLDPDTSERLLALQNRVEGALAETTALDEPVKSV